VDDVRAEGAVLREHLDRESRVTLLSASAIDDRARDLVPARGQRALEVGDERPEVGRGGSRIHLRDEQDAHAETLPVPPRRGRGKSRAYARCASYVPQRS